MPNDETANVDELNFPEISTEEIGNDPSVKFQSEPTVAFEAPAQVPEVKPTEEPTIEETPVVQKEEPAEIPKSDVKVTNPPTQYEGESEIQFNLRKQIYDAGQAKAMASTEEEKSFLSQHIKTLRKELGKPERINTPAQVETTPSQTTEPVIDELAQAKKTIKEMGFLSQEEVDSRVQQIISGQSRQSEQQDAAREFYTTRKDIASNPAQKEALERLVVEKFNITPQSTKQDLLIAMDMSAHYLFPKVNQTAAVRQAADKRELTSFSSNTKSEGRPSNVDDGTRSELKSLGWSDEDINREFQV